MNGYVNPNQNAMNNFGQNKNHMKTNKDGGVKMEDILPKDPYKQEKPKYLQQADQNYEKKQKEIATEQQAFVPDSFKKGGAMNLDIKGNKSKGKEKSWLDNNSNVQNANPQNNQRSQQQQQNNYPKNNNMKNNNNNNNAFVPPQQSNRNMNMNNNPPPPQNNTFSANPPPPQNNNNDNNVHNINFQPNTNNQAPQQNNFNKANILPQQKKKISKQPQQPSPKPYYNKKQEDPFAKYANNPQYQQNFKNNLASQNNQMQQQTNSNQFNQNNPQNRQLNNQNNQHNQVNSWNGIDNEFTQSMKDSMCATCGKAIAESCTVDARERMYHNQCFICCVCGVQLGPLGKYVTLEKGPCCRPCRNKQILASQIADPYQQK